MSIVAARRRTWLFPASLSLAAAIAAALALVLLWKHPQTTTTSSQPFTAAPASQQAEWQIKTFAAGAIAKIGNADKAAVDKQLVTVEKLVRDVYDTQLLDPKDLSKVLGRSFTPAAAKTFENARLGVPKGATGVTSTTRRARIGVNVSGAKSASAEVTISLVGELKGQKLRLEQHSTLWMQRLDAGWRVVGYDVSQGPPAPVQKKGDARAGRGGAKGSGK